MTVLGWPSPWRLPVVSGQWPDPAAADSLGLKEVGLLGGRHYLENYVRLKIM